MPYSRYSPNFFEVDHRRLVRAATRLLGSAEAEDAVQDAYLRLLEEKTSEPGHKLKSTQAWLFTVVRNLAIDRLRRRSWMHQWLETMANFAADQNSVSLEVDAALMQEVTRGLRLMATCLSVEEGVLILLHEVFEVGHAEFAKASGCSEASSRQQLRRALLRIRKAWIEAGDLSKDRETATEATFRVYLLSLKLRDPHLLWAMVRHSTVTAQAQARDLNIEASAAPHVMVRGPVQIGGQLGLVLTLDGVHLCVVPIGPRLACEREFEDSM